MQVLTVLVPQLRVLLGLEMLDLMVSAVLTGAVLLSWFFAGVINRN